MEQEEEEEESQRWEKEEKWRERSCDRQEKRVGVESSIEYKNGMDNPL